MQTDDQLTLVMKFFKIHMSLVLLAALLLVNLNWLQQTVLSGRGAIKSRVVQYGIILNNTQYRYCLEVTFAMFEVLLHTLHYY